MLDFEVLTTPVTAENPSGADLESEGDGDYLNFFAATEPMLPMSYFEVVTSTGERGRFDPKAVDFAAQLATAKHLLSRTRDLRLIVLVAKLLILSRDLDGFVKCLVAIASLLETQWATIHPCDEDGDSTYRAVTLESLDALPTVVNPLQFQPLIENRRFGTVSYRSYQAAAGEVVSTENVELDLATINRVMSDSELDDLKTITAKFAELARVVASIKTIWLEKERSGRPLNLGRFAGTVDDIAGWLQQLLRDRDPAATAAHPQTATLSSGEAALTASSASVGVTSHAKAAAALRAVADYFARSEPSNPARLLVQQAHEMVGKSFVEVMRMLVPAHAESAAINIGRDRFFDLPIERMAALLSPQTPSPASDGPEVSDVFCTGDRVTALTLLQDVGSYFRNSEPSSPIPFLIDRARELAQRDFLKLLQDVLPEGALKQLDS